MRFASPDCLDQYLQNTSGRAVQASSGITSQGVKKAVMSSDSTPHSDSGDETSNEMKVDQSEGEGPRMQDQESVEEV